MAKTELTLEKVKEIIKANPEMAKAINVAKSVEEVNAVLKANGFDFTVEDFKELSSSAALSDDDLDKVNGGVDTNEAGAFCIIVGFGMTEVDREDDPYGLKTDVLCMGLGWGVGYED